MADRSKPRLVQETPCGDYLFAWEEYWTEDNDGFCSTDFLWEKHSRLKVLDAGKRRLQSLISTAASAKRNFPLRTDLFMSSTGPATRPDAH